MGGQVVRCVRTITLPSQYCDHNFNNIYYLPVEGSSRRQIRIQILTADGKPAPSLAAKLPLFVFCISVAYAPGDFCLYNIEQLQFQHTFFSYDTYSAVLFASDKSRLWWCCHRPNLFRPTLCSEGAWRRQCSDWIKPILCSGARILGHETMRTGGKILKDLAENTNSDVTPREIVSKHV